MQSTHVRLMEPFTCCFKPYRFPNLTAAYPRARDQRTQGNPDKERIF